MASSSQATFTPAASSHTTPAVFGGAQEFKSLGQVGSMVSILGCSLRIDGSTETTTWTLHLYDQTPPSALADAASFSIASGDRGNYLGNISLAQVVVFGASCWIENNNIWKPVRLRSSSLFAYLVNGTTVTPAAVAHVVTIGTEYIG